MTSDDSETSASIVFEFSRGFRFQWEPAQQAYVLLYPEGMIALNDTAAEILKRVNGVASVSTIAHALQNEFQAEDLLGDVKTFLEEAHERRWIQVAVCKN